MHGILKTAFGAFTLFSTAHAIPSPKDTTQTQDPLLPTDIHTTEEFSVTLMFDEVITDGNYIWPDGYGNLDWSTNHYIFNQSEQSLFARNHASSPPNLLYVQDSSHSGGAEPYFTVRSNSPAQSFDLHGISILPYTATPKSPILFSIRGYPVDGGEPHVRWYKWTWDAQLQYPWDAYVEGVEFVNKVEIYVVPGADTTSEERLPFTLDNVKLTWKNPPMAGEVRERKKKEEGIVVIENQGGLYQDL